MFIALLILFSIYPVSFSANAQETAESRVVHVYVALADNEHQGIVPVPARLGNGTDPGNNLYWGALYGVKTFFSKSPDWTMLKTFKTPSRHVLERVVFRHREAEVYLVADAYRGSSIRSAVGDFIKASAGKNISSVKIGTNTLPIAGSADLVAYVGHNGLMDFSLPPARSNGNNGQKDVILLACKSKQYFKSTLRKSGANPLLWTTGLMAPEAYTLKSALDGWVLRESAGQVRERAASAYNQYQKCGIRAARGLLVTGW